MLKFVIYNTLMGTYVYRNIFEMLMFDSASEARKYIAFRNLNTYVYEIRHIENGG